MSGDQKWPELPSYEIGYGRPPRDTRFVKGKSGNPKGRPKKTKPTEKPDSVNPSMWKPFLDLADRQITTSDGGTMSVRNAVYKSEAAAALKGNAQAQKHFLDRDERCRKELAQDIEKIDESYRRYIKDYDSMVLSYQRERKAIPDDLPHPDDIVFVEGDYVHLRGGDPTTAAQTRRLMIRFRDLMILQAEVDYRSFRGEHPGDDMPIFTSEYLILHTNSCLPKRMQLTDAELMFRAMEAHALRKAPLVKQLADGWKEFGIPNSENLITPPLKPLLAELGIHFSEVT